MVQGIAIGDALGIAFEGHSRQEIQARLNAHPLWKADDETVPVFRRPWKNEHLDLDAFCTGDFTDDTQLSFAVVCALIRGRGKLGMRFVAEEHVKEAQRSTNGWGTGTRQSVQRLANRVSWRQSGNPESVGNGVLIKLTPLVFCRDLFCRSAHPDAATDFRDLMEFTQMTHHNSLSVFSTVFHSLMIRWQLESRMQKAPESDALTEAIEGLLRARDLARSLEVRFREDGLEVGMLSKRFQMFIDRIQKVKPDAEPKDLSRPVLSDDDIYEVSEGATFYQTDTLSAVWGMLLSTPRPWTFELVERAATLGGDCDSIASIVGGIVGAVEGSDVFPSVYTESLLQRGVVEDLSEEFGDMVADQQERKIKAILEEGRIRVFGYAAVLLCLAIVGFGQSFIDKFLVR